MKVVKKKLLFSVKLGNHSSRCFRFKWGISQENWVTH